ncbi:hypothetical protein [Mycobacterium arosiense]|uniref:HNH endonuclease n=1 Tax=Mycobacterium arosiense ATCC BAA-1401 = DSM 45069 TaxID=1265311 RepID=A0A1W9Z5X0_MYCAI|nr:hypothetical protein [Mycobacterium arosiense]ORA07767.1 hypothetical protein BST14_26465 [Mycobacterium arosiense ATCC BAA-1401 = DSM 45069]
MTERRPPTGIAAVNAGKQVCDHGHVFSESNTYLHVDGRGYVRRMCRECNRIRSRRKYLKRTGAAKFTAGAL